jgi:putative tricarboxylic transport membrane protein
MEEAIIESAHLIFTWWGMALIVAGVVFGIIAGVIPGFTVTLGIVLGLPFTFGMSPVHGITFLVAILIGGYSGGQVSGILFGIPGTPSSITVTFDGYPMALNGEPGRALGIGVAAAILGTLFSIPVLSIVGPLIASFALKFESWEIASLILFALTLVGSLSQGSMLKGLIVGALGLLIATIGLGPTGVVRFSFGMSILNAGFALLPVLIGLYAFSQLINALQETHPPTDLEQTKQISSKNVKIPYRSILRDIWGRKFLLLGSSLIGAIVGAIPALGGTAATFISYDQAQKFSKHPEKFGQGIPEGIIASEAANHSVIGGILIPTLTLGIPGDIPMAIMLGVLILHGITPGPLLFEHNPVLVGSIYLTLFIGAILLALIMFPAVRIFAEIGRVPMTILTPVLLILAAVGSFALNNNLFDVWTYFVFGVIGYIFTIIKAPLAPLILGVLLGPILETNFLRALQLGPWEEFFTRPISVAFLTLTVLSAAFSAWQTYNVNKKLKKG